MARDWVIGVVGKPSAEKSDAKTGSYPFTTIQPNQGVGFVRFPCPCKKYKVKCNPSYGSCTDGIRYIPIKLLDVAGLIPGAHEGLGLGNKFLDDLRKADVLLHVVDVSGTTNEKGEATTGYNPINDHEWLLKELHMWIFNNIFEKWPNIARRHHASHATLAETFIGQFSGYGAKPELINQVIDDMKLPEKLNLTEWGKDEVMKLVEAFIDRRFPFVLALNKSDVSGDADANAVKVIEKYGKAKVPSFVPGESPPEWMDRSIMCSALAEVFLRNLSRTKQVVYTPGTCIVDTYDDFSEEEAKKLGLKPIDEKMSGRLERVRDMVLFRLGCTGVQTALDSAAKLLGLFPVYPLRNNVNFSADRNGENAFPDVVLVKAGSTVGEFARDYLHRDNYHAVEDVEHKQIGEEDFLTPDNNTVRLVSYATK